MKRVCLNVLRHTLFFDVQGEIVLQFRGYVFGSKSLNIR